MEANASEARLMRSEKKTYRLYIICILYVYAPPLTKLTNQEMKKEKITINDVAPAQQYQRDGLLA